MEGNNETAVRLFKEAIATTDNTHAHIHLGHMYRVGAGVQQDFVRSSGQGEGGRGSETE